LLNVLKENLQFYLLLLMWVVVGAVAGPVIWLLLPMTVLLLMRKDRYEEILIGFWFILILSDNLLIPSLGFAKTLKNAYIVLLAGVVLLRYRDFQPFNRYFLRFLPFFIVAIVALQHSETFATGAQKTLSYILLFLAVPNFVEIAFRNDGQQFIKRLVYFFTFILLISLASRWLVPGLSVSHGGRLTGIFGNPNGLGLFSVLTWCLFALVNDFYSSLFTRNEKRLIYFVLLACIIFSGSRNSVIAIFLLLTLSRFYRASPFLGFIAFLGFAFLSEVLANNYVQIIRGLGLEEYFRLKTLEQGGGRYIAWAFAWENIQDNFFIGKGIAYDEHLMRKNYDMLSRLGHQGGVHNTYLILWLNTGLVGLLFYLGGFLSSFISAAKNSRLAFPIMYVVMFTIMFEPWLAASLNPITIIFLVIVTIMINPMFKQAGEDELHEEPQESPQAA